VSKLIAFLKDESGATAIGIVNTLGSNLATKFSSVSSQLE
jgi:Flp pilus assembly pilin Flp